MTRLVLAMTSVAMLAACSPTSTGDLSEPADSERRSATADTGVSSTSEITAAEIGARVEILADDKYGGRAPASEGGRAASQWIADEMARIGLEPVATTGPTFRPFRW